MSKLGSKGYALERAAAVEAIQRKWKPTDWGLMDCDRCPDRGRNPKLKNDHPCAECPRVTYALPSHLRRES